MVDNTEEDKIDTELTQAFLDYLKACRVILSKKYKSEFDIDSDVSIHMHHMIHNFDQFRTEAG